MEDSNVILEEIISIANGSNDIVQFGLAVSARAAQHSIPFMKREGSA